MPRKRMVDPNFWRDEKIGQCSYMERLLFEGLWTFAEDSGVGRASPLLIKADVFPYDTLREADIEKGLLKLAGLGLILLYERGGQRYYFITHFKKHQTINKPSQCYLPTPLPEDYGSTPAPVTSEEKEKEKEEESEEKNNTARVRYADNVSMTQEEYGKLLSAYGEAATGRLIEILDNYKGASGKKYLSDYRAILNWVVSRLDEERKRGRGPGQPIAPDEKTVALMMEEREWMKRALAREKEQETSPARGKETEHGT
ncbi:hypothetical protein SDC9_64786 [bioreactor metagenome]|uniref:DnaD domain-containing protein n=1 Tax=bioreactor metagenome TaxID=1076179 RepID=A0A644XR44_9ZZZZ